MDPCLVREGRPADSRTRQPSFPSGAPLGKARRNPSVIRLGLSCPAPHLSWRQGGVHRDGQAQRGWEPAHTPRAEVAYLLCQHLFCCAGVAASPGRFFILQVPQPVATGPSPLFSKYLPLPPILLLPKTRLPSQTESLF